MWPASGQPLRVV
ncbi:hypothetical protein YPPY60_3456, partial [Yersinia pestis PY-60]